MSRKYYFVQLSTGASQWDLPTAAAPTGPTPNATPNGAEHPYGTPAPAYDAHRGVGGKDEGQVVTNPDGSQSVRYQDGRTEPYSSDRSLTV